MYLTDRIEKVAIWLVKKWFMLPDALGGEMLKRWEICEMLS